VTSPGDTYIHGHSESVLRSHRWRTAENSAAYLLPHLADGHRILDIGCGPGTLTVDLARRVGPNGSIVGVDLSPAVVQEATAHASAEEVGNVTFRTGDFRAGDLPEGSFDVIHAHQVLQHLRDPVGALAAMGRLARPGGIVAARDGDYSAFVWTPADPRLDRWREIYMAVSDRNGTRGDAGRWLLRWALDAGLTDVVYTTSTWTFASPTDRAWWRPPWPTRRSSTKWPPGPNSTRSPAASGPGPNDPTGRSCYFTARSWPGPPRRAAPSSPRRLPSDQGRWPR
jgi:SAM-dependent methyltransferase